MLAYGLGKVCLWGVFKMFRDALRQVLGLAKGELQPILIFCYFVFLQSFGVENQQRPCYRFRAKLFYNFWSVTSELPLKYMQV